MSQNFVWNYFTQHRRPVAECNLCNEWYHSEQVLNLEKHLTREHPEVITKIRETIAELTEYFKFDVGDSEARCTIDNCIVNIFNGIDCLKDHLNNHGIKDYAKALRSEQRNSDQASQSTVTKDNASASANKQPTDALSQDTKSLKELPWANSDSLVWRYFKPVRKFHAKCNICKKPCKGRFLNTFERHLLYHHTKLIDKMRCEIDKEIKHLNLSSYFVCDTKFPRIRCKVDNCIHFLNMFYGTKKLRNHLSKYHKGICTEEMNRISVPRNNTEVITEEVAGDNSESTQVIVTENNASASASEQPTDSPSQGTKNYEGFTWGESYNSVWLYFKPDRMPYAKCKICKYRCKGPALQNYERHLLCRHTKLIDKIKSKVDEEIRCLNLSPYFVCDSKLPRIKCNVDNCIRMFNIFHGTKMIKDHLKQHHKSIYARISMPKNNTDIATEQAMEDSNEDIQLISAEDNVSVGTQPTDELSQGTENHQELQWGNSYVWRYFKPVKKPYAKCNICKNYLKGAAANFEKHLLRSHTKLIDKMRCEMTEEIKRLDLSPYFECDTEHPRIRCNVDNCIHFFNMFHGSKGLKDHLSIYHKDICTMNSIPKNNTDIMTKQRTEDSNEGKQLISAEDNASTSKQPTDGSSQDTENLEELQWGNSNNLVWRYFKPVKRPYAKCNICKKHCKGKSLDRFEEHLLYRHTKLMDEIRCEIDKEIRHLNLSPYFVCDTELPRIRCNVDNCIRILNIFHGTKRLKDHLSKHHKNIHIRTSMPENNKNVMTEQAAEDSNEDIQLTSAEDNASTSKQPTDALPQDTKNVEELPWGSFNNLVWRCFKPDGKPYAKCSICETRCKGKSLHVFERHVVCCHPKLIDKMRCEIDEEIKRLNLSSYFECDKKFPRITCNVDNCNYFLNIFHGTKRLKDHLIIYHERPL